MPAKSRTSLTRNNLREAVYKAIPQLSREASNKIIEEFFEEISAALVQNDDVKLRGFGRFKIHHKRTRLGRNPKTGEEAIITARRSLKFAPSSSLSAIINGETCIGEEED